MVNRRDFVSVICDKSHMELKQILSVICSEVDNLQNPETLYANDNESITIYYEIEKLLHKFNIHPRQ